jgi:P-type Cu+ transporter
MKAFGSVLAGAMLLSGAAFAADVTQTLKITGWHCEGCAGKTEAAIKSVKGVKTATADLEKKQVLITYDDAVAKKADIEAVVTKSHYKVAGWE